jgi:hypothetical protein
MSGMFSSVIDRRRMGCMQSWMLTFQVLLSVDAYNLHLLFSEKNKSGVLLKAKGILMPMHGKFD